MFGACERAITLLQDFILVPYLPSFEYATRFRRRHIPSHSPNRHQRTYSIFSLAASWAALGICYNSGQDCTAGSRVYVQDSIYDKFIQLLVEKVKQQVIGDGLDDKSAGGPVVRIDAFLANRTAFSRRMHRFRRHNTIGCGVISKQARQKGPNQS